MALSNDKVRLYDPGINPMFIDIPGKASTTFYEGGAVTEESNGGTVDVLTASENFVGFVEKKITTTSATERVKVRQQGILKNVPVTGLDNVTDFGVAVYMSDNDTFTLTSTTTNVQIGKVVGYHGTSGYGDVYFQGAAVRSV